MTEELRECRAGGGMAGRQHGPPGARMAERRHGPPIDMPETVRQHKQRRVGHILYQLIARARSKRGKAVVLELFAGSGRVATCARKRGVPAIAVDVQRGPQYDLSRDDVIEGILAHMRAGSVRAIWLGTPCSSWSLARRGYPGAPGGPLRLKGRCIWGHPLALRRAADRRKIKLGNRLAKCTARIIEAAVEHKVPIALENGNTSRLWHFPPIADCCQLPSTRKLVTDMCQHRTRWRKRTRIQTWGCMASMGLRQQCAGGTCCTATGRAHLILEGKRKGVFLSALASRYPWRFERAAARMLLRDRAGVKVAAFLLPPHMRSSGGGLSE